MTLTSSKNWPGGAQWTLLFCSVWLVNAASGTIARGQAVLDVQFNLLELPSARNALSTFSLPAFATFEKQPLGTCLSNFAEAYRVPIWIDRRVDTSRIITMVRKGESESERSKTILGRMQALAKLGGADAALIESVVYVGPADQVESVQRAAVRLHDAIMSARKTAGGSMKIDAKEIDWPELTTPSELRDELASNWSIQIDGELPHDLMHAGKLPATTLATQLTLLYAGFNQQVDCLKADSFVAKPLEALSEWKATYSASDVQANRFNEAKRSFPKAKLTTRSNRSALTGPTDFHLQMLAVKVATPRNVEAKFTIPQLRAPLERIVGDLAKHLGFEVMWSEEIPAIKRQAVFTFEVAKPKSPDEILLQIATDCGVKIERQGQTIIVSPAEDK